MSYTRSLRVLLAVMIVSALMPLAPASAAPRNRAPRIIKAEMKDANGNGLADRIVLTYNEKIRHKVDISRFPFVVQGYKIARVGAARGSLKLGIVLRENANAPAKPLSVKYTRTRKQPVLDLKRLQARKQLLTKNIIGLATTPPPPQEFTLSVSKTGDGTGVISDGTTKINCGATCSAKYPSGTSVTLSATPDAATKATFGGWTGCTSSTQTCTVTLDADKTVSAAFAKAGSFALTVAKAGAGTGTVTSTSNPTQPTQINCGATCVASYPKDTIVTLTAAADQAAGATFAGFSGGGCTGAATTCNVTMDAAKTVTATFEKVGNFMLTVSKAGSGAGSVTSNDGKISCGATCFASYPAGTTVTLTATPDQASGATFAGFTGGSCSGTGTTCNVLVDQSKTVTATFNSPTQYQLTINKVGNGVVTSGESPAKIECGATCTANYPSGSAVTLTATPADGYVFSGWSNGGCTGSSATCNLTVDAAKTVTATFAAIPPPTDKTLTIAISGDGSGGVTCTVGTAPATACNASYPDGTMVTLTAVPTVGSVFAGWSGDCVAFALLPCTLEMTSNKSLGAAFDNPLVP